MLFLLGVYGNLASTVSGELSTENLLRTVAPTIAKLVV
jgi:hypothetical protein